MPDPACAFRWSGPRVGIPETSVIHVCNEPELPKHIRHVCACGADSLNHTHG